MADHTDIEEWRAIEGYPRYEVSSLGRVRSIFRQRSHVLKTAQVSGYPHVTLYDETGRRGRHVHALVAVAFLGSRPDGMQCCHRNSDRTDPRAANLRWDTPAGNQGDAIALGTHCSQRVKGQAHGLSILTDDDVREIRRRKANGETSKAVAIDYGVKRQCIDLVFNRKRWPHIA